MILNGRPVMSDLTEDAKAEIRDAIRIIREDRFEAFVRGRAAKPTDPPKDPIFTPPVTPPVTTPPVATPPVTTPPPVKPPTPDPPNDQKRRSAYWGEIFD